MNTIDAILTRRSIRGFTEQQVPKDMLEKIVKCGCYAPSAKNSQPWNFIVIQNKEIINKLADILINSHIPINELSDQKTEKIRESYASTMKATGIIMKSAPVLLVVENLCPFTHGRKEVINSKNLNSALKFHDSEVISIASAIQNISLASHELGLASVIMADPVDEEEAIKNLLNLKGDLIAILPIGYPAYNPGQKNVEENRITFIE